MSLLQASPLLCRDATIPSNLHRAESDHQADLVNVSEFICECIDVMLSADSDNQSQTSDQP